MTNKPFPLPTGYFGIPLGLGATSLAWVHADPFFSSARTVSDIIGMIAVVVYALFIAMFLRKMTASIYRSELKDEWGCNFRFSFMALIFISTMVIGDVLYRWSQPIGEMLIWAGTAGQLIFMTIRVAPLWKGTFDEPSILPPFYLPTVAANFTSATSLAMLGYHQLANIFLGAGMLSWFFFEPLILRHIRQNELPEAIRPSMGIILAPAFVGMSAYLHINGGQFDLFIQFLWGYGLFQLINLARILPWAMPNGFNTGFWAFSFGLASMAGSAVVLYGKTEVDGLMYGSFYLANILIALLILGTLIRIMQRKFWAR